MPSWARPSSSSEFAHWIALTKRQITAQDERQAPTTDPHHYRVSGLVQYLLPTVSCYVQYHLQLFESKGDRSLVLNINI
jgi:hypothetical protein